MNETGVDATSYSPIRRAIRTPFAIACAVFIFTVAVRWPIRFDGFGEHDQSRFLCDAILYRYEGGDIHRKYFLHTSPLALAAFAGFDVLFGHAALLPLSNVLAVLSGGVIATAAFVVARGSLRDDAWAAAAAIGSTCVPGVFFTTLYGYPSIYSLAFLSVSAAALSHAIARPTSRAKWAWLGASAVAFVVAALLKVDFALMGTWLLAIVLLHGPRAGRAGNVVFLVALAIATVAIVHGATTVLASDASESVRFGREWFEIYLPFFDTKFDTRSIFRSVGRGTAMLLVVMSGWLVVKRRTREAPLVAALLIAVAPLWLFWASIPPLSTRHCIPGALVTGIYAGVLAAKLWPRHPIFPFLWPVLLVASNWWGRPYYDLNYHLSGDLYRAYRMNRDAFAAAEDVAGQIARDPKPVQVWVGSPSLPAILGRIDIIEIVRYRIACEGVEVHNQYEPESHYHLYTRRADGTEKIMFYAPKESPLVFLKRTGFGPEDYLFLSMTRDEDPDLKAAGLELRRYDLRRAYHARTAGEAGR